MTLSPDEYRRLGQLKHLIDKGKINEDITELELPREQFKEFALRAIEAQREIQDYLINYDTHSVNASSQFAGLWRTAMRIGNSILEETATTGRSFYENTEDSSFERKKIEEAEGGILVFSITLPYQFNKDEESAEISRYAAIHFAKKLGFLDATTIPVEEDTIMRLLNGTITSPNDLKDKPRLSLDESLDELGLQIQHPSEPFNVKIRIKRLYHLEPKLLTPKDPLDDLNPYGKKYIASDFEVYYHQPKLPPNLQPKT